MKKVIVVFLIILLIAMSAVMYTQVKGNSMLHISASTSTETTDTDIASGSQSQEDFNFKIPTHWGEKYTKEVLIGDKIPKEQNYAKSITNYKYKGKSSNQPILLSIVTLEASKWNSTDRSEITSIPIAIANGLVFVVTLPVENPFQSDSSDVLDFAEMMVDIPTVQQGFSVKDGIPFMIPVSWNTNFLVETTTDATNINYEVVDKVNKNELITKISHVKETNYTANEEAKELGRSKGNVYLLSYTKENPYPKGSIDAQLFETMRIEKSDTSSSTSNSAINSSTSTSQKISEVKIEEKSIKEKNDKIDVNLSYPAFSGINDQSIQQQINDTIQLNLESQKTQITTEAERAKTENPEGFQPYKFSSQYEVKKNDTMISVVLTTKYKFMTSDDEIVNIECYNLIFDPHAQDMLLSQLFQDSSKYKELVNEKIKTEIAKKSNASSFNFSTITDYQTYYVDKDNSIVIVFQPQEIAPADLGPVEIKIPASELHSSFADSIKNIIK